MSKEKAAPKNSKSNPNEKDNLITKERIPFEKQEGYTSRDNNKEELKTPLPNSFTNEYQNLVKTEQKLVELNDKITKIKDLLKPVSRIDKKRGVKSTLTPNQRKFHKAELKYLERERFIENQNLIAQSKSFKDSSTEEITRTKKDLLVEQGRSGYYARKYQNIIVGRIKTLFDKILEIDFKKLDKFHKELMNSEEKKISSVVLAFIKGNEENPFLSTFYQSHKELHMKYNLMINELLSEWDGKPHSDYSFKESQINIKEEIN